MGSGSDTVVEAAEGGNFGVVLRSNNPLVVPTNSDANSVRKAMFPPSTHLTVPRYACICAFECLRAQCYRLMVCLCWVSFERNRSCLDRACSASLESATSRKASCSHTTTSVVYRGNTMPFCILIPQTASRRLIDMLNRPCVITNHLR